MRQEKNGKNDKDNQQDGKSCSEQANEIAQRMDIFDQLCMLSRSTFDALPQHRDLIFNTLYLDRMVLKLEVKFAVRGLHLGQALLQLFLVGRLLSAGA